MNPREADGDLRMSFWGHLAELRKRLVHSAIAVAVGCTVAYFYAKELFALLMVPFNNAYQEVFHRQAKTVYISMQEPFLVYLKVGLVAGIFLASPFLFLQIWKFIAPGLRPRERKHVVPFVLFATLFFVGGALFGYFGVFPIGFRYFLEVAPPEYIEPMIRMDDYYKLASGMMLVFGLVFEAPLIVLYLVFFGLIKPRHLLSNWRGIVVGITAASAILTPADPGSMLLMMAPLLVLYGITILFSFVIAKRIPNIR